MFQVPEKYRIKGGIMASDHTFGNNGKFQVGAFEIIASDGEGWEHVSVSLPNRCPTWEETCAIKKLFWHPGDCVVQYHPPEKDYVNCHPYCLHLWRPTNQEIPTPPAWMVGPKVKP